MRRQRSILFFGIASEGWCSRGRPNRIPQDGVATTMATPEMLPMWRHVEDVLIANMLVRVAISTSRPSKGGRDERWGSKSKKFEFSEATKMIRRVWQGVSKIDRKGLCSLD